jgi:CheY-like chemotaxis protein
MAAVLLVEDVAIVRTILRKFVESAGHAVTECAGADEACRLVERTKFDVVVTDLWMKDGNGLELMDSHCKNNRPKKIIAMTGGDPQISGTRSLELAREAGALRVLVKPVTRADILDAIDYALAAA